MLRDLSLKDRQLVVQSLWTAVNDGGHLLDELPRIVRTVIETGAWAEREVDGRIVAHKRFVDFITTNPRAGCGWQPEQVEALIKNDAETLAMWRDAVTPARGGSNHDNVMIGKQGNSRSYTLSRLKRERPQLFERVVAGELSANAAAIEAGFRHKPTPFKQIKRLLPKLTPDERRQLLIILSETAT